MSQIEDHEQPIPPPVLIPVVPVHGSHARTASKSRYIWRNLLNELSIRRPDWRENVEAISVDRQRRRRENNEAFSDAEVVEAMVLSILSNSADWYRVQKIRDMLRSGFFDYDPLVISNFDKDQMNDLYANLVSQKVGSLTLGRMLILLQSSVAELLRRGKQHESFDDYILSLFEKVDHSPEKLALALGLSTRPRALSNLQLPEGTKLPGFGIALAAEALRNLGYDLAKPDRHILRAFAAWDFVEFSRWDRSGNRSPHANPCKLWETMLAVKQFAKDIEQSTSLTDTTIWFACSRRPKNEGPQMSNTDLALLAR